MTSDLDELTCRELVELVTDYLEGALPTTERLRIEEHLAVCEGCARYIDQMRRTIALTEALRPERLDPHARDTLMRAFRSWTRG
jgi:anti-sigma factor RsiW